MVDQSADLAKQVVNVVVGGVDVAKLDELWKSKVDWTGTPHANGTVGHWETITNKVDELVQLPDVEKVYINKGLSNEVTLNGAPNNRPDIMVVKKDGTIDIYEVPSKTDSIEKLIDRSLDNLDVLGEKAGDYFILPIEK